VSDYEGEPQAARVITEKDLGGILAAEKADALASMRASVLSIERTDSLNYYLGNMDKDMPTVEGRSRAVSTDVSDTIEGMLPDLCEIFCGGEEVVKFKPVGPEDVPASEQETAYINHVYLQKNPGFMCTYTFLKDGLLSKVGIVKVIWENDVREESETYLDQSDDVFALVQQDEDCEVTEHTEHEDPNYPGQKLHDFTVVTKKTYGCCKVLNVPPEEFGIARRARVIHGASQSQDASYMFHEVSRYESDLIDEGYDPEQVRSLPTYGKVEKQEEFTRDTVAEGAERSGDSALNQAMRPIRITEHYIKMDYEKQGKTKLYRVMTGGEDSTVMRWNKKPAVQTVDFMPFAAWTPVPQTHRFFGRSISDLIMEVQRIKTAILRAYLNNLYLATNPRYEVSEAHSADRTLDDLIVSRPGGVVRVKEPGGLNILEHPDISGAIMPAMEYMDSVRELRTGMTRQGFGLDSDALNNQTATAAQQLYNASKARLRMIARIFAETGFKDLFWLMHATIKKHGDKADVVQLENNWVSVDPRQWKTRKDLTVSVGIGTGDKNAQLQQLMILASQQKEALAGGLTNLVTAQNLYNTAKQMCKLLGLPAAQLYWTDPSTQPPPQQQPDPKLLIEQMKAQSDQQRTQAEMQVNAQKAQAEMLRNQQEHNLKLDLMIKDHAMRTEEHKHKLVHSAMDAAGKAASQDDPVAANRHARMIGEIMQHVAGKKDAPVPVRVRKLPDGSWIKEPVH
jgi:hypothetical protein